MTFLKIATQYITNSKTVGRGVSLTPTCGFFKNVFFREEAASWFFVT